MKKYKIIFSLGLIFAFTASLAQQKENHVEMADVLRQEGKIYAVVLGLVVILTAMIIFLIRVDRKLFKLENKNEQHNP